MRSSLFEEDGPFDLKEDIVRWLSEGLPANEIERRGREEYADEWIEDWNRWRIVPAFAHVMWTFAALSPRLRDEALASIDEELPADPTRKRLLKPLRAELLTPPPVGRTPRPRRPTKAFGEVGEVFRVTSASGIEGRVVVTAWLRYGDDESSAIRPFEPVDETEAGLDAAVRAALDCRDDRLMMVWARSLKGAKCVRRAPAGRLGVVWPNFRGADTDPSAVVSPADELDRWFSTRPS